MEAKELKSKKEELEVKKLEAEIKNLRRPHTSWTTIVSTLSTAILAIATITIAFRSNLFDSKNASL